MIDKIIKLLTNKKNKIEGQRISEKWFLPRKLLDEWSFLKENNISDTKTLYMYVNNESDKCECGNERRFKSFKDGFVEHCEKCSRTKFSYMQKVNTFNYNTPDINFELRKEIKLNLYKLQNVSNKKYSSARIKTNPKIIQQLINTTFYLPVNSPINERIYHVENNMFETKKCKKCKNPLDNFISIQSGYYSEYCKKNNCAFEMQDKTKASKPMKLKWYPKIVEIFTWRHNHTNNS